MIQPVVFQANAVNESGDVLPYASVYVVDSITNNPVDLFSDYEEIPTPILNPITADANGAFKFFCQRQVIDIIVTSGGFSRTWSDVFLQIPQLSSSNTGTSTTIAVTESGSEARSLRRKTEAAYWSGQQEFESAILSGSTSAEEITFGTPSGTKNSGGTAIIYGQLAINGNTNIKDLSEATDPKSLLNIGGVLKWGSNDLVTDDMLGTAAFADLTTPSATIWDDGNLVKTSSIYDQTANSVMLLGCQGFGFYDLSAQLALSQVNNLDASVNVSSFSGSIDPFLIDNGVVLHLPYRPENAAGLANSYGTDMFFENNSVTPVLKLRNWFQGTYRDFVEVWHTGNTTVDINGFIKEL